MKNNALLYRRNQRAARAIWGRISRQTREQLRSLTETFHFSVMAGDVRLLNDRWYVTHSGLIGLAHRRRCAGIRTRVEMQVSNPSASHWVFKAAVYKAPNSSAFVGYGDANPSNVSPLVRGAEMRVAETRAVNRALRKAYGIGLCSVEELGWLSGTSNSSSARSRSNGFHVANGSHNGQPRLRDRLCLLIRQHNLDPSLVKGYAADFCGTAKLREASRERVEAFISRLAGEAKQDRDALDCKLNSYAVLPR